MLHKKIIFSKAEKTRKPAIFCDRDGVLIKDCDYISNPNQVKILKGVQELLNFAKVLNWHFIIITNQSGIHRGILNWIDYESITQRMLEVIGHKDYISGIYANSCGPHSNDSWRKPNIGMIKEASIDFNIDIKRSILIGDRLSDMIAGYRASCRKLIHVETGHGVSELNSVKSYFEKERLNNSMNNSKIFFLKDLLEINSDFLSKDSL